MKNNQINDMEPPHRDIVALTNLSHVLQTCLNREDMYQVVEHWASHFFPELTGTLSIIDSVTATLHVVAAWGDTAAVVPCHPDFCQLLQGQCFAPGEGGHAINACPYHIQGTEASICVPIQIYGNLRGVLHLHMLRMDDTRMWQYRVSLAEAFTAHLALALMNISLRERLSTQATRDPLTNLFHRGYLEEALHYVYQHAARFRQPVGMIMLDIDHFKEINDTYGHQAGDVVLQTLGACVRSHLREGDIACRYGGDEFTLLFPGTSLQETQVRAEALQKSMLDLSPIRYHTSMLPTITLSLGIASFPEHGTSGAEVLREADRALYRAKATGRDQIRVALSQPDQAEYISHDQEPSHI
jgi:diguanylate cyclase (GGDEF)-like protein